VTTFERIHGWFQDRYAALWPYLSWSLFAIGAVYCAAALMGLTGVGGCGGEIVACDAAAYYYADGYHDVPTTPQYLYSPAFLTAFAPFRLLPWDMFLWVWFALHVGALLWLRAGWFLAIPGVNEDVIRGNIGVFIAVAIVLGLRYGTPWAFVLLTKVAPAVGMVWHLARREWRQLAWATGLTVAIVGVGGLVNPQLWAEWFAILLSAPTSYGTASEGVPWTIRIVLAAGVIAWGARTDRAWLVPVGIIVGAPGFSPPSLMKLAALPRLLNPSPRPRVAVVGDMPEQVDAAHRRRTAPRSGVGPQRTSSS
jgi:Glycosyltransferase family 87